MFKFLVKRGVNAIFIIVIVSMILHFLVTQLPSDEVRIYLYSVPIGTPPPTQEQVETALAQFGLDGPWYSQYYRWLGKAVQGDFGMSVTSRRPVMDLVKVHLARSFLLNILAFIMIFIISIPVGIRSALKKNSFFDHIVTWITVLGTSVPSFYFALFLVYQVAGSSIDLPISGMRSTYYLVKGYPSMWTEIVDVSRHMVLPVIAMTIAGVGLVIPYVRNAMIDVLNQDYIRTAKSKGLMNRVIIYRHAFRNALIPLVSMVAVMIPTLFIGNIFIESVFSWPGIGYLFIDGLVHLSRNMILATTVFFTIATVLGNLLSDVLYSIVDPRIKVGD